MNTHLTRRRRGRAGAGGQAAPALAAAVLAAALAPAAAADAPRRLGVEDAVALARRHNERLLIAREDAVGARGAVREAYAGALPQVTLQGTYQGNFTKPAFFAPEEFGGGKVEMGSDIEVNGALRVDQVLYAFGRVGNAIEFARIYEDMADAGVDLARGEVSYAAREAYYRVLLMKRVADIRRRSLAQARSHLERARAMHAEGLLSDFELLRARVEVKNREPQVIAAENDVALARQDLQRVLGIDGEPAPVLTDSLAFRPAAVTEAEALAEAYTQRPELRSLALNIAGREKVLAIEKAERLPILGLFGQVALQGAAEKDRPLDPFTADNRAVSTSAGVTLSLPLFDGFRTRGKVQQAGARLRRAEFELAQARKGVRLEVTKALQDLASLRREHEAQRATVALAAEAYRIAETRYANGLSTQLELKDAETELDAARTRHAETLYRYNVALAALERALGRDAADPGAEE